MNSCLISNGNSLDHPTHKTKYFLFNPITEWIKKQSKADPWMNQPKNSKQMKLNIKPMQVKSRNMEKTNTHEHGSGTVASKQTNVGRERETCWMWSVVMLLRLWLPAIIGCICIRCCCILPLIFSALPPLLQIALLYFSSPFPSLLSVTLYP